MLQQNIGMNVLTSLFYVEEGTDFIDISFICLANDNIDIFFMFVFLHVCIICDRISNLCGKRL